MSSTEVYFHSSTENWKRDNNSDRNAIPFDTTEKRNPLLVKTYKKMSIYSLFTLCPILCKKLGKQT